jgi:hypothetical protein
VVFNKKNGKKPWDLHQISMKEVFVEAKKRGLYNQTWGYLSTKKVNLRYLSIKHGQTFWGFMKFLWGFLNSISNMGIQLVSISDVSTCFNQETYPLVNIQKVMENHHFSCKSAINIINSRSKLLQDRRLDCSETNEEGN